MRKQRIARALCGAVLMVLALTSITAGAARAQDRDTPWLGVTTQEITRSLREGLDYQGSGVLVNRVIDGSPADDAGLRSGDVIVSFNSRSVTAPQQLTEMVRAARVGQTISLAIVRDGSRRTLSARLASWPGEDENLGRAPEAPEAPEAPAPPRAPTAERRGRISINGQTFDMPDADGTLGFSVMGRGRLGVQVQELNEGLADALGISDGKGVLVIDVVKDTPASRAGIRAGDVIVRVDDRAVADVDELHRALPDREGRVSVTVVRRGSRRTLEAELEAPPRIERLRANDHTMTLRIPDVRSRVLRDLGRDRANLDRDQDMNRESMEREIRELRDQVRELRRRLEAMNKD